MTATDPTLATLLTVWEQRVTATDAAERTHNLADPWYELATRYDLSVAEDWERLAARAYLTALQAAKGATDEQS